MTLGKNKRISKGGKRSKKKTQETMSRKEWYDIVAPLNFEVRQFGKTICNKTQGIKVAADFLRGRVFESNLADLNKTQDEDDAYRKVKLIVQEVQGRNLLTQFYGMDMTSDRIYNLLRKWCTTIEATVEAKTADGYMLRLFVIAFTSKQRNQLSKNCYAKTRLVKWVRMRVSKIITWYLEKNNISKVLDLLTRNILRDRLKARCNAIVPLRYLCIRKVKVIRTPKYDPQALLAAHGEVPASLEGESRVVEAAEEVADE
ncbi:putative Ribosomal S3Ae family [Trypanosoma vivax]|uniref:Small ribosomal subunit protein eS1 n=1 Tax=Trypanosoma vivax (strain Y486) TaxID=1055687 RepID=G0U643_TRYVY|nr:putative 40S ribosomal protein S3A [Trypanosoma vivax]KAH8607928.1 putative Ribosomal S3Ae family [Trypanosoma vivax]KAH8608341.1 putative Ribosomal S3Ae family [Trypanosoma vivax]CCC51345.1 putative 40S ribosomal protein S3A [Trypanosoma vivax Y486]CCC51346.1 putative ribosomal protein S3a [Trypanosoma vivax Y486]